MAMQKSKVYWWNWDIATLQQVKKREKQLLKSSNAGEFLGERNQEFGGTGKGKRGKFDGEGKFQLGGFGAEGSEFQDGVRDIEIREENQASGKNEATLCWEI